MIKDVFENTEIVFILQGNLINKKQEETLFAFFEEKLDTSVLNEIETNFYESTYLKLLNKEDQFFISELNVLFDVTNLEDGIEVDIGFKTDYEFSKEEQTYLIENIFKKVITRFGNENNFKIKKAIILNKISRIEINEFEI